MPLPCFPRSCRVQLVLAVALALLAWPQVSVAVTPSPATSFAQFEPLYERRTGVSESEPRYCTPTLTSDDNPSAVNTKSLEAGPGNLQVDGLEPGRSYWHCFHVFNRKPTPRTIELTTLDVIGSLDPDQRLEVKEPARLLGSWIRPVVTKFTLEPGERALIPYELRVPAQPPVGSSIGAIRLLDVTDGAAGSGGARVQQGLTLQVEATFPGGASRELDVTGVRAPRLLVRTADMGRYRARYVLTNRGSIGEVFTASLVVDGLFGRRIAKVSTRPDVLAPGSAQRMVQTWEGVPWIGRYRPKLVLDGSGDPVTVQLPTFWVVPPWPYVVGLLAAIAILIFGVVRRRRSVAWRDYVDEEGDEFDYDDRPHGP